MSKNPFQYLRPVPPESFVGRWPLVREIAEDLVREGGESHAVIAGRRCGKSSLLVALAHQLRQPETVESGDWLALPILFDFKSSSLDSEEACLAEILEQVRRRVDKSVRRPPRDAWPNPVELDAPWFRELVQAPSLSARDFADALGYLLDELGTPLRPVRLALLCDEMDELVDHSWTDVLFNQLRWLIYSSDLKEQVRLVLTGSQRFLDEVSDRGSPLWNVLMFHYLGACDQESVQQLVSRAEGLSEEAVSAVWRQSGGQLFLAQFLLYHLCKEGATAAADAAAVHQLATRFLHERLTDLEGWARAVGVAGLLAYGVLADAPGKVEESEIVRAFDDPKLNVKRGLTALCYHGLVVHDRGWEHYQRAGDLFQTWYVSHSAAFLPDRQVRAEGIPGQIHAQTVIISPQGPVEVGDRVSVGNIEDATGIAIGHGTSADVQ